MDVPSIAPLLPQLASGAAHTHALGFTYESLEGDRVRIRVPWREDLVGDPDTGVIAGGGIRAVLELAGIQNVLTKSLGSQNSHNTVKATLQGLGSLRNAKDFAKLRNVDEAEIVGSRGQG